MNRAAISPYFLVTRRLGLRAWSPSDLPLALRLWGNPAVTRLFDARGALSREQVQEKLTGEIRAAEEHGVQYWPVFLRDDHEFVGCCGLKPHPSSGGVLELGFHLCPSHWRNGYATEAARRVIAHAFASLGVGALFAGHHPDNVASQRVLEKLGFRYTHDEFFAPTGREHRSYLLRDDPQATS